MIEHGGLPAVAGAERHDQLGASEQWIAASGRCKNPNAPRLNQAVQAGFELTGESGRSRSSAIGLQGHVFGELRQRKRPETID